MRAGIVRIRAAAVAAIAALVAAGALLPLANHADAAAGFKLTRLFGGDRYETAADIAIKTFGTADDVLLARGDLFPDALAGSYLAGQKAPAPILLTTSNTLSPATKDALKTLKAKNVYILGGTSAVSKAVADDLDGQGYKVTRISGDTRFDTALAAAKAGSTVGKDDSGKKTAMLASGLNFPDALAGGPVAYAGQFPILLTDPAKLSSQARDGIKDLGVEQVLVLGGNAAVADSVDGEIKAIRSNIVVTRLAGANRRETATKIQDYAADHVNGWVKTQVNLARGDAFADALSGGPHGGKDKAGNLLTVDPTTLGTETCSAITKLTATITSGHVYGGTAAVSNAVVSAAETCGGG